MMDTKNLPLIMELAKKFSMYEPKVSVLDEDSYDQYLLTVRALDSCLKSKLINKTLALPELRNDGNETIAIYSDYGGEAKSSAYLTYSFLVCAWNHAYGFPDFMGEIRKRYGLNEKEISFKDIRYGPINRSLDEYLNILQNCVPGLLVTIVIDKKIQSVFGKKVPDYVFKEVSDAGFGDWKPRVIEKLMRVVHVAAYLVALLSKSGQKIYWCTDNDAIVANDAKQGNFIDLFDSVLTLYTKNKFERIGYSVPFEDRSLRQLDFLSCPDLAAGAVEHYFTKSRSRKDFRLKKDAGKILQWLGRDGIALKKVTVLIDEGPQGGVEMSEVKFQGKDGSNDGVAVFVPARFGQEG